MDRREQSIRFLKVIKILVVRDVLHFKVRLIVKLFIYLKTINSLEECFLFVINVDMSILNLIMYMNVRNLSIYSCFFGFT